MGISVYIFICSHLGSHLNTDNGVSIKGVLSRKANKIIRRRKNMRKTFKVLAMILVIALALSIVVATVACKPGEETANEVELPAYAVENPDYSALVIPADFKIGLICLHDENSTYDKNFIEALNETQQLFGLTDEQVLIVTGVPEGDECYQRAAELADAGCDIIFADSFGHETYMIKATKEFTDVQFCHATGTKAHTENLPNYSNAFASIYEGRFLAGVAAGMKLNEMIADGQFTAEEAQMGYVGAWTYAEVISGYSSFYLGAKSICPTVTMEVEFTGSWYDETAEFNTANKLINNGAKLISQHADSMGAPNACEAKNVPNVSYNGTTVNACPETFIISSKINWSPYFNYVISQVINEEAVAKDWVGTIQNGGVQLTNLGAKAMAEGTVEKIVEVRDEIVAGTTKVYDINTFTVQGAKLESYLADVHDAGDFVKETEVIIDGYFQESVFRSAPYFDLTIDGITLLNSKF